MAIAVSALACLLMGCAKAPPQTQANMRAMDEQTIRESEIAWSQAYGAKNLDRILLQYADDASSIVPGVPMMTGIKAIRAGVAEQLADPEFALSFHTDKVEVSESGDMAYSQGSFTYTGTDIKSKRAITSKGHYVEVYKKQSNGSWKVVEDIATNDGPATASPGP